MAKVVQNEPDWESVPPAAVRLLKRCLSKPTRDRLHDIADVRIELVSIAASPAGEKPVARHRWPVLVMAGAMGIAAGALLSRHEPTPEVVERRLHMRLGDVRIDGAPVLSPDGSVIVFRAGDRYFMRRLDEERAEPLSTRGSVTWKEPFFSPDGKWIGISDAAHLFKVSIDGGPPSLLAQAGNGDGNVGRRRLSLLFGARRPGDLSRVRRWRRAGRSDAARCGHAHPSRGASWQQSAPLTLFSARRISRHTSKRSRSRAESGRRCCSRPRRLASRPRDISSSSRTEL